MKHLNYLLLGAAGLMLASCSQDDLKVGNDNGDGTSNVALNINLPELQTRVYGDGTTATKLMYAVYEIGSGNSLTMVSGAEYSSTVKDNAEEINISKVKNFTLLNDKTYKFVFWAESAETTPYTVTWDEDDVNLEVKYADLKANNENLDAFYGTIDLTVKGNVQMDAPLYRPLAQINIGTDDLQKASDLGYDVEKSSIKAQAKSTMNLINGKCENSLMATRTFAMNAIPKGEKFPVEDYDYLAMTYVLVPADKEVTSVSFDYIAENESEGTHTRTVSNVPVQRNHRTNIYGQILTGNAELTVTIEPIFDDFDLEPSPFDMIAGLGGTLVLEDNVELSKIINFTKDAVIDLNGQKVTSPATGTSKDDGSFTVRGGANVTIKGDGEMETAGTYASILVWAEEMSTITIENGTFTSHSTGSNDEVIYIGETGGTIYIKGGTFKSNDPTSNRMLLNCYDKAYEAGIARFVVTGGTFYGYDPAHANSEPTKDISWVAPGYKSVETGEENGKKIYTVLPENVKVVNSSNAAEAFADAAANGGNIFLSEDVKVAIPGNIKGEMNIDLNDYTLTLNEKYTSNVGDGAELNISNGNLNFIGQTGVNYDLGLKEGGKINLENLTISTLASGFAAQGEGAVLNMVNCEMSSKYYSISTNASVTPPSTDPDHGKDAVINLENCKFSVTSNLSSPILINVPATLNAKDCEFSATPGIQAVFIRAGLANFENCIFNNSQNFGSNPFRLTKWGDGNNAVVCGICIGNQTTGSYQWPAQVTFVGNNVINIGGNYSNLTPAIHAYSIDGYKVNINGLSNVTIYYPSGVNMADGYQQIEYATSNIFVDGQEVKQNVGL